MQNPALLVCMKNSNMKICPHYENVEPLTYMRLFIDSKELFMFALFFNSCLLFAKGIAKKDKRMDRQTTTVISQLLQKRLSHHHNGI